MYTNLLIVCGNCGHRNMPPKDCQHESRNWNIIKRALLGHVLGTCKGTKDGKNCGQALQLDLKESQKPLVKRVRGHLIEQGLLPA